MGIKGKVFYGQEPPSGESTTTECGVNYQLLVAVNHNQLRTMASEPVDPIDWSHPPPSWAVPPEPIVHSINQCNLSRNRTCNRSMRGNHLAYAASQGMNLQIIVDNSRLWTIASETVDPIYWSFLHQLRGSNLIE